MYDHFAPIGRRGGQSFANARFGGGLVADAATLRRVAGLIAVGLAAAGVPCEWPPQGAAALEGQRLMAGAWAPAPPQLGCGAWKMFTTWPADDYHLQLPGTVTRPLGIVDQGGAVAATRIG